MPCFLQVRCKNEKICSKEGTKIIVTDRNDNTYTGLVLSQKAFGEMAVSGKDGLLLSYGVVDVEFKRLICLVFSIMGFCFVLLDLPYFD